MAVTALATTLLVIGIHESTRVNNIIVIIKVAIVVLFIVAGAAFIDTANWRTAANPAGAFVPPNLGPGEFGWSGVFARCRGGVLRLYRLRLGFHRRPGSQESAARYADRHFGLARRLRAALPDGGFVVTGVIPTTG